MNKKLIRLTEGDLHRIVKESVNKILNEIGNTPKYQYLLGSLAARQNRNNLDLYDPDDFDYSGESDDMFDTLNYAADERKKHPEIEDELQNFHNLGFEDHDDNCIPKISKKKAKEMRRQIGV